MSANRLPARNFAFSSRENIPRFGQPSRPMKKTILLLPALLAHVLSAFCRADITFTVEELSKPEKALPEISQKEIFKKLIGSNLGFDSKQPQGADAEFPYNIVAQSKASSGLVNFERHSFFQGMQQAYAEHRPFVISPDMIWLLISQGFARHVNANSEKLRSQFVDYSGKISLVVTSTDVRIEDPNAPWETIFPQFTRQIAKNTGRDLTDALSANFSTTTPAEKIASDITIMEAMKSYFIYILPSPLCGIPKITLLGTPEDWRKISDKTKQLAKYDLAWWTDELVPVLKEFVNASQGKIEKEFWRNMFKIHLSDMCGTPDIIDGWIVKFFPYTNNDKRNNLKELRGWDNLPSELVIVDLSYVDLEAKITIPLELWAGFIGLDQDSKNYTLTPKIGWMIRKADSDYKALRQNIESEKNSDESSLMISGLELRVKEVPPDILEIKQIDYLSITFVDKIIIPDRMAEMKIENLFLQGKIDEAETKRIKAMFPKTRVYINGEKL